MNREAVKDALRQNGDEYHYRDADCDIGGDQFTEGGVEVTHFVVRRDARGNGIASTLIECLIEVMREDDLTYLTIEMGATECRDHDELKSYREEHGQEDPTYVFLENRGFKNLEYKETYQWGLCVRGTKYI